MTQALYAHMNNKTIKKRINLEKKPKYLRFGNALKKSGLFDSQV
jgi:hypothetical protein